MIYSNVFEYNDNIRSTWLKFLLVVCDVRDGIEWNSRGTDNCMSELGMFSKDIRICFALPST